MQTAPAGIMSEVPAETLDWLLEPDNPAIAVLTRRTLLGQPDSAETTALWARRNDYAPVAAILDAQHEDGSWHDLHHDYQKYGGSLWQIVFLGELWASAQDPRVQRGADYAFSRQKPDGGWSANPKASYHMPCLTANVGRGLARMGWERDERVIAAIGCIADGYQRLGFLGCSDMQPYTLNGYCHMLAPKVLLFLGEVPDTLWPDGAGALRDACVEALRDKEVFRSLPEEFAEFKETVWPTPAAQRPAAREQFIEEHPDAALQGEGRVDALRLPAVVQLGRARGAPSAHGCRRTDAARIRSGSRARALHRRRADALDDAQQLQRQDARERRAQGEAQ